MPDWDIEIYDVLDSTQRLLKDRAEQGAPEGTVIQASAQQSGQGRHGNHWVSPAGNLYCSLLLRPSRAAHDGQWAGLSYCTGLALARTLEDFVHNGSDITLKWPNDILINKQKVSGLLLDMQLRTNTPDWIVIGIGINISSSPEGATHVQAHSSEQVQVNHLRDRFLESFSKGYDEWLISGFKSFQHQWLSYAPDLRGRISARTPNGEIAGTFVRLDTSGALCLRDDAGQERRITAGEIYHVCEV